VVGVGGSALFLGVCVGSFEDCVGPDIVVVCVDRSVLLCSVVLDVLGVGVLVASGWFGYSLGSGSSSPSLKLVHSSIDTRLIRFDNVGGIRASLRRNQRIGQLRSPIDRMDGSIDNRTLTHLLSIPRWTTESPQLLGYTSPIRDRNGSCGLPIRRPECKHIANRKVNGGSCECIRNGIPDETRRWVRTQKVNRTSQWTGT
jgi:hypothetical protein